MYNKRKIDERQTARVSKGMNELAGIFSKPVGGSGSKWQAKGDVFSSLFLAECKDKEKPSKQRTIYKDHLNKIRLEAINENKIPLYIVAFGDGQDYMILHDHDFYELMDELITLRKLRDGDV